MAEAVSIPYEVGSIKTVDGWLDTVHDDVSIPYEVGSIKTGSTSAPWPIFWVSIPYEVGSIKTWYKLLGGELTRLNPL